MSVQGKFLWNELMAKDVKKSSAFYTGLLGWEVAERSDTNWDGLTGVLPELKANLARMGEEA